MTTERFKNTWQPPIDSYAKFSFYLDLNELKQQIRKEAEQEHAKMCESCIHKVSKEDIDAIRADAIEDCKKIAMADCTSSCEYPFQPDCIECMCNKFDKLKEKDK